jgi:glyoxylate reductase
MTARANVLVTRPIMEGPTARLRERCDVTVHENEFGIPRDELLRVIEGRDAIITMLTERVDTEFLDAARPGLKVVANHAVGFDNIDVDACTAAGVLATNTPDVLTETTADTAFALLMAAARRVGEGERFLRAERPWIWGPLMMLGQDVHHKTIGIVGFGRIGQAVARRARGFGMRVLYSDAVELPAEVTEPLGAERRELPHLLHESDFVSIHTNLTPETRHLFDAAAFEAMRPTAVLVNTSRGPVIDEAALADALEAGEIFAAGLDVFEREPEVEPRLLKLDNVVIVPHLGSATIDTRDAMGYLAVDNVFAALDGAWPPTLLNPDALAAARPSTG